MNTALAVLLVKKSKPSSTMQGRLTKNYFFSIGVRQVSVVHSPNMVHFLFALFRINVRVFNEPLIDILIRVQTMSVKLHVNLVTTHSKTNILCIKIV
jgi:hypothetical protein